MNGANAYVDESVHDPCFEPLNEEDASRVRELELLRKYHTESPYMFYGCTRCRSGRMSLAAVEVHCSR